LAVVEGRLRDYVTAVMPDCSADGITSVSGLDTGENHAVYKVSYLVAEEDEKCVVVRLAISERGRDRATAEREAAVLSKVQGVAGPLLYDFRAESPWFDVPTMCMQFVDGDQRPPADIDDAEQLGRIVGWLHGLPTDEFTGWSHHAGTAAAYLGSTVAELDARLALLRDPLPRSLQQRFRQALSLVKESLQTARCKAAFDTDDSLVLLHGDVAGGNIMWAPAPLLIDWEYARIGDAADEVAYIFDQNSFTELQRTTFWHGYADGFGDPSREHVAERVRYWEPLTLLGSATFWGQLWSRRADDDANGDKSASAPRAQEYYRAQTIQRLDRLDALLDPPRA
jgi:aminoglycoside phosphotransferase (APT) family kinase protein